jgi:uncharacterized protein (DUF4415 family)
MSRSSNRQKPAAVATTAGGREFHLDVTNEQVAGMRARGIDEEAIPKVGRHTFRSRTPGRAAKFAPEKRGTVKVRVNIYLDSDVVEYFKGRAKPPDAAAYQTQINNELRRVMEADAGQASGVMTIEPQSLGEFVRKIVSEELDRRAS